MHSLNERLARAHSLRGATLEHADLAERVPLFDEQALEQFSGSGIETLIIQDGHECCDSHRDRLTVMHEAQPTPYVSSSHGTRS